MVFVLFEMNANVVAYPINIRNKNCKKSSVNIRLWLWLCLAWTRKTTTQMRGTSRPYSVLLHIFSGMKLEYSDLRAGHKFMNITEEGKDRIWIKRYCGDVRNGYLWFRNGSGRLFSKGSSQKWSGESLPVEESEKAIWCELGEVKEDGGHSGNRKGFKLSGREAEILNEIIRILKDGSQVENFLDQLGHSISAKIAVMVMESEKDVKMVFRFFLWATQKTSLIRDQDLHILMIQILKESKEFEVAWDVLREMRKGKMSTAAPFNVLIAAYGKVGMVEKAIESFTLMEEEYSCSPNIFTWNIMLDILVNDQMTEIARALYQRMLTTDCLPNAVTLNILIRGLCNAGKTQEALDFYDEMNARGITANIKTYTIVIKSLCQAGKINMATQLLASMEANNCSPDIVIYNVIINGLCKNGQVDQAFKLLNVLKEEKVSPTGYTYSSLIHGLFKASRFDEACKYCRDFFELQITPDLVSYTVMIDAFCEVGRIDDAFHFFNVMIRTGCLPDTFCYNTLIKGLCKVGLLDEARSVKLEMLQKGCLLDVVTYNTLIFGLCEEGLVEEAHQMLDEMTRNGYFPNVFTYNILIDALFKVGEVTKACILFYQMEMGNSPSLFLNIAQGSKRFGDSADLQALAEGHCSTGLILDAYKLHRRLMESGAVPDVITYNTMINGLCKTCKLDAALKFFKAMHVRGYIPNVITYNTLIDGLCRVNREKDAFTLFQQMAAKGCGPNSVTFKTLMTSLCQEGQEDRISQAFNLWVSYISQRYSLNNQDTSRIQILFNQGNFKEAFRTVVQIDATAIQNSADSGAYCILIIGLCRGGRLDDALKLFASIHESNFDITAPTYIFLITGLCNEGKETKALELFTNSLKRGIFFNLNPDVCDRLFRGM